MRKLSSLLGVLVVAAVLVGCGSSGGSDSSGTTEPAKTTTTKAGTAGGEGSGITEEQATAAFVSNLSSGSEDAGQLVLSKDDATCVAPRFVKAITVEALRDNDIKAADIAKPGFDGSSLGLTEEQGQQLVDAFGACDVDIYELFVEALTGGLTAEQQTCTKEKLDRKLANALLVKTFSTGQSDKEFEAVVNDLTQKCNLPPD